MTRRYRELAEIARRYRFEIESVGGHVKLRHVSGALYFCASTPSDWRSRANIESSLRRIDRRAP